MNFIVEKYPNDNSEYGKDREKEMRNLDDMLNKNQFHKIKIGYQFLMSGLIPKMNKVLCEFDGPEFLGE